MASRNTPVPSGKERRAPLVMVVDDESVNVQIISALLTERGYNVLPALSGEEALARSVVRRPDLAIFDLKMPGMDGVALCRRFREIPELAAVPVIFVTGTADEERGGDAQAGARPHLNVVADAKGVDAGELE